MKARRSIELALAASRQRQKEIMDRDREAIYTAILNSGKHGITRAELARVAGIHTITVGSRLQELIAPKKRIHVADWLALNGHLYPIYVAGDGPDVEKPALCKGRQDRYENAEELALKDARASHTQWASKWRPHCDVAAEWMTGAWL